MERQKSLQAIQEEVTKAQRQARGAAGKVREETSQRVAALASRLEVNESRLKQQQETSARVSAEINVLRQSASSAESNVSSVITDVKQIHGEVASTRTELEKTIADLKRTTGDLGVMSGLIATNSREIEALKQLGDRDYIEFTLYKRKEPIRIGDVSILLKKTDTQANTYTLDLHVGDRKVEKKDRTANEPVQFFVGRERQPHELVINEVGKDRISGYLAVPKVRTPIP